MGHHSCCNQQKVKRGLWSPEEDEKLVQFVTTHGYGCWSEVPEKAGLQRCGKSCRLRWINYLRPDIRRGRFTSEEEKLIIRLHEVVGNRWAHIASHLPGRTDNEIKNYWNSWIKKKIQKSTSTTNSTTQKTSNLPTSVKQPSISSNFPLMIEFGSDHLQNKSTKGSISPTQESKTTLIPSSYPSNFMFDTTNTINNNNSIGSIINQVNYQHNQQQVWGSYMSTINLDNPNSVLNTTITSMDLTNDKTNYMPSLVESIENLAPMEAQQCTSKNNVDQDHQIVDNRFGSLDQCLPSLISDQTHDNNQFVGINLGSIESQSCPNFLLWDHVEGLITLNNIGDDMQQSGPTSSSLFSYNLPSLL